MIDYIGIIVQLLIPAYILVAFKLMDRNEKKEYRKAAQEKYREELLILMQYQGESPGELTEYLTELIVEHCKLYTRSMRKWEQSNKPMRPHLRAQRECSYTIMEVLLSRYAPTLVLQASNNARSQLSTLPQEYCIWKKFHKAVTQQAISTEQVA